MFHQFRPVARLNVMPHSLPLSTLSSLVCLLNRELREEGEGRERGLDWGGIEVGGKQAVHLG